MLIALSLMAVQGTIGAFDTLYYHEWRARLPGRVPASAPELRIHALRDFLYALLFGSLPWIEWHGLWIVALGVVLATEIVLTMWDFVVEIRVRKPMGDVFAGERITHAVMAIIYGSMLANLLPVVVRQWWPLPTALVRSQADVPELLRWALSAMAAGVFFSGVRDLYAALGLPYGRWPWTTDNLPQQGNSA